MRSPASNDLAGWKFPEAVVPSPCLLTCEEPTLLTALVTESLVFGREP